jgi:hypothetical protein
MGRSLYGLNVVYKRGGFKPLQHLFFVFFSLLFVCYIIEPYAMRTIVIPERSTSLKSHDTAARSAFTHQGHRIVGVLSERKSSLEQGQKAIRLISEQAQKEAMRELARLTLRKVSEKRDKLPRVHSILSHIHV